MTDLTLIQRTTGAISKNDFIVCRKKAKPQQGRGAKPKAYPPDAALPNRQTKKLRKKKKRKTWGGERGKKKFIIIKDKSYE